MGGKFSKPKKIRIKKKAQTQFEPNENKRRYDELFDAGEFEKAAPFYAAYLLDKAKTTKQNKI
jgi:hypothetical protein